MYECVFDAVAETLDCPHAFTPSSSERGLVIASPGGETARLSVMGRADLDEDRTSDALSRSLTEMAGRPIRVFPVATAGTGGRFVQAYGASGSLVLAYSKEWASDMPHPRPRAGAAVEVELEAPAEADSGIWAIGAEVRGSLVDQGRRIPGTFVPSLESLIFRPSGRAPGSAGARCRFLGEFDGVQATHWRLRCEGEGVFTVGARRGRAVWVAGDGRVGVRFESDAGQHLGSWDRNDETATVEDPTLSVDPGQIELVDADATVLLRRPE